MLATEGAGAHKTRQRRNRYHVLEKDPFISVSEHTSPNALGSTKMFSVALSRVQ